MNFFNDRELARRFKRGEVPARERFLYLLVFVGMGSLFTCSVPLSWIYVAAPNQWDIFLDVSCVVITLVGTFLCYDTNRAGDGREFIERYISLSFPILIQALLLAIPLLVALYVITGVMEHEVMPTTAADFGTGAIIMLYYYIRLNQSMRLASQ